MKRFTFALLAVILIAQIQIGASYERVRGRFYLPIETIGIQSRDGEDESATTEEGSTSVDPEIGERGALEEALDPETVNRCIQIAVEAANEICEKLKEKIDHQMLHTVCDQVKSFS